MFVSGLCCSVTELDWIAGEHPHQVCQVFAGYNESEWTARRTVMSVGRRLVAYVVDEPEPVAGL